MNRLCSLEIHNKEPSWISSEFTSTTLFGTFVWNISCEGKCVSHFFQNFVIIYQLVKTYGFCCNLLWKWERSINHYCIIHLYGICKSIGGALWFSISFVGVQRQLKCYSCLVASYTRKTTRVLLHVFPFFSKVENIHLVFIVA